MDYLQINKYYWTQGFYNAPNVESWIFRLIPMHFKKYGIPKGASILDFGCGQGATVEFFNNNGYKAYGVDISANDISVAKQKQGEYRVIDPLPKKTDDFFPGVQFDLIIANQSLYYYSESDLSNRLDTFYTMMKPGGYVYFSMISTKSAYYKHTELQCDDDDIIYKVDLDIPGYKNRQDRPQHMHYITFTRDENELRERFKLFKPLEIGYYDTVYLESEGSSHHYTFFGQVLLRNDKNYGA